MKRHALFGHFGSSDRVATPRQDGVQNTKVDLLSSNGRLSHGLAEAIKDSSSFGSVPTEVGLDLLILASMIHAADTRISRASESQDSWTREIDLVVPVSDPALWKRVSGLLTGMMNFLSGDRWTFSFRSRPKKFMELVPPRTPDTPPIEVDSLSLFSGGLDSLIGAIDLLAEGKNPLFVSHAGEAATSGAQHSCFEMLEKKYPKRPFGRLRIWMNFETDLVKDVNSEMSMRARSFLFFALGVFAGTGLGKVFVLRAPENGLIALNVPLDPLRLGAFSTRTTHPFYIARWNQLIRELGFQGKVENPYWNQTKGEMVSGCGNKALLRKILPVSLSCASPTKGRWKGLAIQHCGHCLPCLIRRAAVEKAWGRGKDPTTYTLSNLKRKALDPRIAEGEQIRAFQHAIARLQAAPGIESVLIHKPAPLVDVQDRIGDLSAVYRRGMEEIGALLAGVTTRAK